MSWIDKIWNDYLMTKKEDAWLIGLKEFGTKEIGGDIHNDEVLKYFHQSGFLNVDNDELSWCAAFVNWCIVKSGRKGTLSLAARSFMNWGTKVTTPKIGDVAVFWRESPESWKGHVGFLIREDRDQVWVLGGNQSNQVNIMPYQKNRLLGYRR